MCHVHVRAYRAAGQRGLGTSRSHQTVCLPDRIGRLALKATVLLPPQPLHLTDPCIGLGVLVLVHVCGSPGLLVAISMRGFEMQTGASLYASDSYLQLLKYEVAV